MPNWSIQLSGDKFDLEDFPKWFPTPDLQVVERPDGYYLKSELFEAIEDADQVRASAQELLERLVGAAKVYSPSLGPVGLSAVVRQEEDGRRHAYVYLSGAIKTRSKTSAAQLTVNGKEEISQVPRIALWAPIAKDDEKVRQALRLWVKGSENWAELYKVLEIILSEVGGAIYSNGWVPSKEVKRFKHTADSAEALGDQARHAKKDRLPPRKPMTIQEAKRLIKGLLERWIDSKISS
jgi:hypothetical protein